MSRTIPYFAILLTLFACDKSKAEDRPEDRSEDMLEDMLEARAEEGGTQLSSQGEWGEEIYTDGTAEDFYDDDDYGGCDDSDCASADDGADACDDDACAPPPVVHKKFTGKAAKVEKQILKEQLREDVAKVEALLEDLDTELAKK